MCLGAQVACGTQGQEMVTASVDNQRSGWASHAAELAADHFDPAHFGIVFRSRLQGTIRSQPLVAGGDVYVATDLDWAYRLDGSTGAVKWKRSLGRAETAGDGAAFNCADVTPSLGVLSSPVIDTSNEAIYLVARDWDGADPRSGRWQVHALSLADGGELSGWPIELRGTAVNDPSAAIDGANLLQRPALTLLQGRIWIGIGGVCDRYPFRGWLASVAQADRRLTLWTTSPGDPAGGGGIWQSGGGPADDGTGHLLIATGDGNPDRSLPRAAFSQSVLRIDVSGPAPVVVDQFRPDNASELDSLDIDVGSGNPIVLPEQFTSSGNRRLVLQVSKEGVIYLLDRDQLGSALSSTAAQEPILSRPAVWPAGQLIFVAGTPMLLPGRPQHLDARLRAYKVVAGVTPRLEQAGVSGERLEYGSGSPLITSDGTRPGSALVWLVARQGADVQVPAELRAYDAEPHGGALRLRYSVRIGTAPKFTSPATDGRHVYVANEKGELLGFAGASGTSSTGTNLALAGGTAALLIVFVSVLVWRRR